MAQVNIRIDDELKLKAETLFDELGLNMSTAVTMFIKACLREGGIPFKLNIDPFFVKLKTDPFYSESNMRVLRESIRDADEGKLTEHELIEV